MSVRPGSTIARLTVFAASLAIAAGAHAIQLKRWVMPPVGIDFTGPAPSVGLLPGGAPASYEVANGVHDLSGNLLFYVADGGLYDGASNFVAGFSNYGLYHETVIVPAPGHCRRFYLFHTAGGFVGVDLYYTLYDAGTGIAAPEVFLATYYANSVGLAAAPRNADGSRFLYAVGIRGPNSGVDQYRIGPTGVTLRGRIPTPSLSGDRFDPSEADLSHDGTQLAWASASVTGPTVTVLKFNPANLAALDIDGYFPGSTLKAKGVEFSPDGSTLWVSRYFGPAQGLYSVVLSTGIDTPIPGSGSYARSQLELAADGYIYAASGGNLGRLETPNNPTALSVFVPAAVPGVVAGFTWSGHYTLPDQIDGEDFDATVTNACCVSVPTSLIAWFPFDEPATAGTATDIAQSAGASYVNTPTPIPGMVAGALRFDGIDDYAIVPAPALTVHVGEGDFSVDAWIRTDNTSGTQIVLDKRVEGGTITGYSVFTFGGRLGVQLANGDFTNYISTVPIADNQWHLVAVTVDREDPQGGRFYIDGAEDLLGRFNPTGRQGNLNNDNPFTIGARSSSASGFWRGDIDELEIFSKALSVPELTSIWSAGPAGKCKSAPHVPWDTPFCLLTLQKDVQLTVCNHSTVDRSYAVALTGLPVGATGPGGGCSVAGPVASDFQILDPLPVAVAAGTCEAVDIRIRRPSGLTAVNQVSCYEAVIQDVVTLQSASTHGSLQDRRDLCVLGPLGGNFELVPGDPIAMDFTVRNDGLPPWLTAVEYVIEVVSGSTMDPSDTVSLNGLPPGEPVTGTLDLLPKKSAKVTLDVVFDRAEPARFSDLLFSADTDADGVLEPLMSVGLRSAIPPRAPSSATSAISSAP